MILFFGILLCMTYSNVNKKQRSLQDRTSLLYYMTGMVGYKAVQNIEMTHLLET